MIGSPKIRNMCIFALKIKGYRGYNSFAPDHDKNAWQWYLSLLIIFFATKTLVASQTDKNDVGVFLKHHYWPDFAAIIITLLLTRKGKNLFSLHNDESPHAKNLSGSKILSTMGIVEFEKFSGAERAERAEWLLLYKCHVKCQNWSNFQYLFFFIYPSEIFNVFRIFKEISRIF